MTRRKGFGLGKLLVLSVGAVVVWYMVRSPSQTGTSDVPADDIKRKAAVPEKVRKTRPDDFDASPATQADRKKFIQERMSEGYFEESEVTGSLPKLWVTPSFLVLQDKYQNPMLSVVYAYWMGELETFGGGGLFWDPLILKRDNGTMLGKRVGQYTPVQGIELK